MVLFGAALADCSREASRVTEPGSKSTRIPNKVILLSDLVLLSEGGAFRGTTDSSPGRQRALQGAHSQLVESCSRLSKTKRFRKNSYKYIYFVFNIVPSFKIEIRPLRSVLCL